MNRRRNPWHALTPYGKAVAIVALGTLAHVALRLLMHGGGR